MRRLVPLFALALSPFAYAQDSGTADAARARLGGAAETPPPDEGGGGGGTEENGGGATEENGGGNAEETFGGETKTAPKGKKGKGVVEEETPANAPEQYTVQPGDTL